MSCDMTIEGGGWLRLQLIMCNKSLSQSMLANPFYKCDDDAVRMSSDWINDEVDGVPDIFKRLSGYSKVTYLRTSM